jgi:S1-C subfamily serine protease
MDQQKLLQGIVRIHAYGRPVDVSKPFLVADRSKGVGTGMFVHPPSSSDLLYILTCSHCVDMADTVTIMLPLMGMTEYPANVVSILPAYDLAILSISMPSPIRDQTQILPVGSSSNLKLGQKLTAVGYPLGGTAIKASDGVYAGFQERLQHTVSISPGNSGGPLMNENGEIVGVNNSGILSPTASNVGFAVPIECYELMKGEMFKPSPTGPPSSDRVIQIPLFGFEYAPITRSHARAVGAASCLTKQGYDAGGVQIITVIKGSPMDEAGLNVDDILVEFDGQPIDTIGELDVNWNYQKVRLQDVLARSVEKRTYTCRIWKASTQTCATLEAQPRVFTPGALRTLHPPYDTVPYLVVVGLVIMPLVSNHATYPATMSTYLCKKMNELAEAHLIVSHVFNGTIAQIEGPLVAGDELSHINNREVNTLNDVRDALPQTVTTSSGHTVLTFRSKSGKTFMVSTLDALATEKRASEEKLYVPEVTLMSALDTTRKQ